MDVTERKLVAGYVKSIENLLSTPYPPIVFDILNPIRDYLQTRLDKKVDEPEPDGPGEYVISVNWQDDDGICRYIGTWEGFAPNRQQAISLAMGEYADDRLGLCFATVIGFESEEDLKAQETEEAEYDDDDDEREWFPGDEAVVDMDHSPNLQLSDDSPQSDIDD